MPKQTRAPWRETASSPERDWLGKEELTTGVEHILRLALTGVSKVVGNTGDTAFRRPRATAARTQIWAPAPGEEDSGFLRRPLGTLTRLWLAKEGKPPFPAFSFEYMKMWVDFGKVKLTHSQRMVLSPAGRPGGEQLRLRHPAAGKSGPRLPGHSQTRRRLWEQ
jgi:hypothetical protein